MSDIDEFYRDYGIDPAEKVDKDVYLLYDVGEYMGDGVFLCFRRLVSKPYSKS
jgi:hypothetical protein